MDHSISAEGYGLGVYVKNPEGNAIELKGPIEEAPPAGDRGWVWRRSAIKGRAMLEGNAGLSLGIYTVRTIIPGRTCFIPEKPCTAMVLKRPRGRSQA